MIKPEFPVGQTEGTTDQGAGKDGEGSSGDEPPVRGEDYVSREGEQTRDLQIICVQGIDIF